MKKLIFTTLACLAFSAIWAQPAQNDLYFGGSLQFNSNSSSTTVGGTTTDDNSSSFFSINPRIGYTFSDNLMGGIMLDFSTSKQTNPATPPSTADVTNTTNTVGGGLFARYYIPIREDRKFLFFPEANLSFLSSKSKTEVGNVTTEYPASNTIAFNIMPGFAFYPSERWGIELAVGILGVSSTKSVNDNVDPNVENKSSSFTFALNPASVSVGVSYLLPL